MKPRNKHHHRIVGLANGLFTISNQQREWAHKECLEHRGYATKNRVLCLDCGDTFSPQLVSRKKAVCPHCGTKLQIKESRCTTDTQTNYFAITEIVEEFQVVRNFEINAYYKKGEKVRYHLHEILQYWIDPNKKVTMFGKMHNTQGCCDNWCGYMEIREESRYGYSYKYEVYARKYHPDSVIKPEYKKYGINTNLQGLTFIQAINFIPNNPKLETLLKAKQYGFLEKGESYQINSYWDVIKICLRNKYKVKDVRIYFDYLDLLKYFKKDLRNAKYVCPKNLKKEHDFYMKRKREIIRIEEMKRDYLRLLKHFGEFQENGFEYPKNLNRELQILLRREKLQKLEKRKKELEKKDIEYQNFIKPFKDIVFCNKSLKIIPLLTIEDFKKEGDKLDHCVFTNEYFNKKKSLILSARINNEPIETIEIDLEKLKITQSRGFDNKPTEHHDLIVGTVTRNLSKIAKIVRPKKRKKSKKLVESI